MDDEPYECPMCTFMKGGNCKDAFVTWEECVDRVREKDGDLAGECGELFMDMHACMMKEENRPYYAPMLEMQAEMVAGGGDEGDRTEEMEGLKKAATSP
jgi:mitochondrial intermembrane space import and assembly protein 40